MFLITHKVLLGGASDFSVVERKDFSQMQHMAGGSVYIHIPLGREALCYPQQVFLLFIIISICRA